MGKKFPFAEELIGSFDVDNAMATTRSQRKNLINWSFDQCVWCGMHLKEIPDVLWKRTSNNTIAVLMTA